jgi:subtilisin family serine protease
MAVKYLMLLLLLLLSPIQGKPFIHRPDFTKVIPNQYIVVFKDGITPEQRQAHIASVGTVQRIYNIPTFSGYAATLDDHALEKVRSSGLIAFIEADQVIQAFQSCQVEPDATWGIDRIDTADLPLQSSYTYSRTGAGVDAYIVDTGIYIENEDFEGRAEWGANFVGDVDTDCNGHGTHVAGTVGSATFGVAKDVTLIAVKVLGCSGQGTTSGVIDGITWVANQASSKRKPSVANMSLGGGGSVVMDNAIKGAIGVGVTFVVAAGNDNADACDTSPARVPEAITVGATDIISNQDVRATFSNYGSCVDVFAPGVKITSTWIGSPNATATISGTSMASPHTAGVAALLLEEYPTAAPDDIANLIVSTATSDIIDLDCRILGTCKNSPNKMLFSPCN